MVQKIVDLAGIGPVTLAKRRGAKNIRLSIQPNGRVRVGLPVWLPYAAGISFTISRAEWIRQNRPNAVQIILKDGHRIGKSHRLAIISSSGTQKTQARLGINSITITSNLESSHHAVQKSAVQAAERALKKETQLLLGNRLRLIAAQNGLSFSGLRVKRLSSRWGSCSSQGLITLNYFLVQLPWHLIDYVIVHELAHTRYLNHSRSFWSLVENIVPDAKVRRREIKKYQPILLPS